MVLFDYLILPYSIVHDTTYENYTGTFLGLEAVTSGKGRHPGRRARVPMCRRVLFLGFPLSLIHI